jgi:hypothetical protein
VKLNEAACLKVDISSFQAVTDRFAKLVGYANSFPNQQWQNAARILFSFLADDILLGSSPDSMLVWVKRTRRSGDDEGFIGVQD